MSSAVVSPISAATSRDPAGASSSEVFVPTGASYGSSGVGSCSRITLSTVPCVSPKTFELRLLIAIGEVNCTDCDPEVAEVEISTGSGAPPGRMTTGRCAFGAPAALRSTWPSRYLPTGAFFTSAVIVSTYVAPGASVNRDGETVSPSSRGPLVFTVQVALEPSVLLMVRVHVQLPSQSASARLAALSV